MQSSHQMKKALSTNNRIALIVRIDRPDRAVLLIMAADGAPTLTNGRGLPLGRYCQQWCHYKPLCLYEAMVAL